MYVDTNVFLLAKFDITARGAAARKILRSVQKTNNGITSTFTIYEAMGNVRKFSQAHVRDVVEEFYLMRGLRVVTMSVDAPKRALEHMELHNLKPADALHLAIMEDLGETVIVSDDKDFDGIAGITRVPL